MASKFASLVGKRGLLLVIAAVASVVAGRWNLPHDFRGFWDGPG